MKYFLIMAIALCGYSTFVLQAKAQITCDTPAGTSPFAICGNNGGTASQLFTPGSVIILQRSAMLEDLIDQAIQVPRVNSGTSRNSAFDVSRENLSFPFFLGEGVYNSELSFVAAGITEDTPAFDQTNLEFSYERQVRSSFGDLYLTVGANLSEKTADSRTFEYTPIGLSANLVEVGRASETQTGVFVGIGGSKEVAPSTNIFGSARLDLHTIGTSRIVNDVNGGIVDDNLDDTFDSIPTSGSTVGIGVTGEVGLIRSLGLGNGYFSSVHGLIRASHNYTAGFTETSDISSTTVNNERGLVEAGDASFTFADSNLTQVQSELGFSVSRPTVRSGRIWVPSISASWIHDFSSSNQAQTVTVSNDFDGSVSDGSTFELPVSEPDRDYFRVGVGLLSPFENGSGFWAISYDTTLGHSFITEHRAAANFIVQF